MLERAGQAPQPNPETTNLPWPGPGGGTKKPVLFMKRTICFYQISLFLVAFFFQIQSNWAQHREPLQPQQPLKTATVRNPAVTVDPFVVTAPKTTHQQVVSDATYLQLDAAKLRQAMKGSPREIVFRLPQKNGADIELLLEKQDILSPDFSVVDGKGNPLNWQPGQYYRGRVLDRHSEEQSTAALSIVGDEVMAMMNLDGDNYVLGTVRDKGKQTTAYVLYNDQDIVAQNPFQCGTEASAHTLKNPMTESQTKAAGAKNVVRVQFDTDYQMFLDFGSYNGVANYVTGLFNMVATIYHNESIPTQISQLVIWTSPDPFPLNTSSSSGDVLNAFVDRKNTFGINGDLAHLLSTKPLGHGGIAWIDVLCYGNIGYRTAYSNIATSYQNFPLYSWTIDVVTHEMGHNLGSPHTHDCAWGPASNQALDNCYTPSGGCAAGPAPTNGGTIMSYCHLTAAGKNFNLGFGTQPGNLIRNKVSAAACLSKAWLDCAGATPIYCGVPVNGSTVGLVNNVNTYGCNSWLQSGPEKVYILQTTEPGTITATLSNLSADLDVIILDACTEGNCLAEGNNSASVANASPGTYFIVVDGYGGAQGSFTLSVSCSGVCYTSGLTNFEFIQRVQLGTIDHNSGNNYGYGDFTNQKTPVQRGGTVGFSLTPGFVTGTWNENWGIWIDINKDNDFNDYGEFVYASPGASSSTVTGSLTIPAWAQLGKTRMRIGMRYGSQPTACGTFYGEVEDYTVEILPFCPALGNTKYEFIESVAVGSLSNVSGNNSGYADYTALTPLDLLKGQSVPVTLTPGFTAASYNEFWSIWIDYNHNFTFEASELVFEGGPSALAVTGSFIVPTDAQTGLARMRISMAYGGAPSACSYLFYGETEDYTVNITPFCPSFGNSTLEHISTVGVGELLNESGNNGGYADFTGLVAEVKNTDPVAVVLIPGFGGETEYKENWRIWVDFNQNQLFEEAELVFEEGGNPGLVFGAFSIPDTIYEGKFGLRVSMRYGAFPEPCGNIGWGEVEDYTLAVTKGEALMPGLASERSGTGTAGVSAGSFGLFPNPAEDVLNFDWADLQPVAIQLVGQTGQTLRQFSGDNVPNTLDVSGLPAGLYSVQVSTADSQLLTKRFVKVVR